MAKNVRKMTGAQDKSKSMASGRRNASLDDTQPLFEGNFPDNGVGGAIRERKAAKNDGKPERYFDYDLLLCIIFLMAFGLIMLYSTSAYSAQSELGNDMYYFVRQLLIGLAGFLVMWVVCRIDYHLLGWFSVVIYWGAFVLMALVQTPLGVEYNGAKRWLSLPGNFTMQPSEVMKIAIILYISYELCRMGRKAWSLKGVVRVGFYGLLGAAGVYFLTDNLSTAVIVFAITCVLIFVFHPKTKPFILLLAAGAAAVAAGVAYIAANAVSDGGFRIQRILYWLYPEEYTDSGSYQLMQGLYAIGSGGFFGKGLGNSTQKLTAIPEAQNDMILAVICEELGVFGVIVLLCLFAFLLYRLVFIARNAPDVYGSLVAVGIFAHIALQVILNVGVVTGLLPTTGITLPFISYGGTAVLFLMAEMGIALGISSKIVLKN